MKSKLQMSGFRSLFLAFSSSVQFQYYFQVPTTTKFNGPAIEKIVAWVQQGAMSLDISLHMICALNSGDLRPLKNTELIVMFLERVGCNEFFVTRHAILLKFDVRRWAGFRPKRNSMAI